MAEWLVEEGIGETRAIRLVGDRIVAARLHWPDALNAGGIVEACITTRRKGQSRGVADLADGTKVLVDRLPSHATEGTSVRLEILRPALVEAGRGKLARGRVTQAERIPAPSLIEQLRHEKAEVRIVRRFPGDGWDTLIADAFARYVAFPGGSLVLAATPAMTLIDVDGDPDPRSLSLAACEPIARMIRLLDLGGSIGVDFPTLTQKAHRREVDQGLAIELADWPHERTAMNGFGFVQFVSRLERPSILHRATFQHHAMAARILLRQAEALHGPGCIELTAHPALQAQLRPEWLDELRRRTACDHRFRPDPGLAFEAPHAQLVAR